MSTTTRSDRVTRALLLALSLTLAPSLAHAQDPSSPPAPAPAPAAKPLDSLRERFREGMDKYKSGAFAEAIVIWESIYRELGSDKGYRLAFDLARAYDEIGEQIKAAEHFETYLDRVAARRREGELLEPQVAKQETDARERLEKIAALKARIHVAAAADHPVIVRVDNTPPRVAGFTIYVEPGDHVVAFGADASAETRNVTLKQGELLDVDPPAPPAPPPPPPETRYDTRTDHPFSPVVLWIGAGVAVASVLVPILTYSHALSVKSDYDNARSAANGPDQLRLQSDYATANTNYNVSVVVTALLTAATGGLTAWYFLGTKETRVPIPITPQASIGPSGASAGFSGAF